MADKRKGTEIVDGLKEAVAFAKTGKGAKMTQSGFVIVDWRGALANDRFFQTAGDANRAMLPLEGQRIVFASLTWEP